MQQLVSALLCLWLLSPSVGRAEEAELAASEESELAALRHSRSYQEGITQVRDSLERAYDLGAVRGAAWWQTKHDYFLELATAKGCAKGSPYSEGPVKVCNPVSEPAPKLLGPPYEQGRKEIASLSRETPYPELTRKIEIVIFDYGYVQGMKHGLRKNNDNLRWTQAYYKACVQRVGDPKHEPECASASTTWSKNLLDEMYSTIDAFWKGVAKGSE
jgi:hypothetical protein